MTDEICNETADSCVCHKEAGHVENGDPIHTCEKESVLDGGCKAQWTGSWDDGSFWPLVWPTGTKVDI